MDLPFEPPVAKYEPGLLYSLVKLKSSASTKRIIEQIGMSINKQPPSCKLITPLRLAKTLVV